MQLISGRDIAAQIYDELAIEIEKLAEKNIKPHLTVVLVGEDPASAVYVGMKEKACIKMGMDSETIKLPVETTQDELLAIVDRLNKDPLVHGILVQLPLPKQIDSDVIINSIDPEKDVDGFHPFNRGLMVAGQDCFLPCTPYGVQMMLQKSGIEVSGKHVVVVGRSLIVGMPVAIMLVLKKAGANATVTICHTGTKDMAYHTRQADILIVAAGRANTITGDMIKEGAVIIDVGTNRKDDPTAKRGYRLVGDVDFDSVKDKVSAISPVPFGVGPMTIVMLIYNTVKAAKNFAAKQA